MRSSSLATSRGSFRDHHLDKPLGDKDFEVLARAVDQVYEVFEVMGVPREQTFYGTLNAGHPGGCFPRTREEATTLHHASLPANLYLADASLFPRSMGNPPILTIMALAKRVARTACNQGVLPFEQKGYSLTLNMGHVRKR